MKRVVLSIVGTVAGLSALLGFKSHGHALGTAAVLPSAALPGTSTAPTAPTAPSAPSASASAAPKSSASKPATATTTQTFDGDAVQTPYGVVQVRVSVSGTKITDVKYLQLTATDGQSQMINSYAAPILLQETLSAQSANVDTVSGASYTSAGYMQSLQSALDKAGIKR